ncbi:MAG: ribosome biogenesis GTPase Der, partial [Actinobacteria bacterium]|nr:ribosome biogenesis GTPase Der [Actinomycetota bacterium]
MSTQPIDLPLVAVVGRPNVGKSTLFNRIVGRREAIVEEKPGVTRDRKEVVAEWQAREFRLVDTGGWMPGGDSLDEKVSKQSEKAILEADVVLFVVDVTVGITEEDSRVAQILRRNGRPVLLVANKVDDTNRESAIWDLLGLGVGNPFPVSALHGRGTGDLLESLMLEFPPEPEVVVDENEAEADKIFSVSIVGRPNVGKSTLFNRLIGDERSVVHDMPGTTRDAVDTIVETEDGPIRFVDTAGMRR